MSNDPEAYLCRVGHFSAPRGLLGASDGVINGRSSYEAICQHCFDAVQLTSVALLRSPGLSRQASHW